MRVLTLNNFCELIPVVLGRKNCTDELWFRGQRNSEWPLLPGAFRKDPEIEGQRLVRFKMYAPALEPNCPNLNDYQKWLPLMQHHGVPTRLLDWTISPLIALFFAVYYNNGENNAALFMFEPGKWVQTHYKVKHLYAIESTSNKLINDLINNAFSSKTDGNVPIPIYSETNFQRSFIQQSVFTIHDSLHSMDFYDKNDIITKFIIPSSSIEEFKCILLGLGISEIAIFSDLDTLGKWTKEHLKAIR